MGRRLLIVAPAFPPHPSPATHRARYLCRYGPEAGWDVEVLTVDPKFYEEPPDRELEALVPPSATVERVPALSTRWTRRLGVGDLGLRSYLHLWRALRDRCRRDPPDVLFFPGGPFYPFLLGARVNAQFGLPYVLDFTDPWVYPPHPADAKPWKKGHWAYRLATALEPRAVRNAAHVLAVSDGTNDAIRRRYPDVPADRFSAVPFGFEAADFDELRRRPRVDRFWERDGNLHLVYVGAMLPNGYETLRALLRAVSQLRAEQPEFGERLRLHFFGTTYDPKATRGLVTPVATEMGLGAIVSEHPRRIPYVDALQVLTSADGVLTLGSSDHHYTASKIFPCILARRPLLAVYHEASTVCDVMRETGAGALVSYGDVERAESRVGAIAAALERLLSPGGYDPRAVRLGAIEAYSARATTRHIFDVFDRVAPRDGAWPAVRGGAAA